MAGITGSSGVAPCKETVERMLQAIEHRGPDTLRFHQGQRLCAGVRSSKLSPARGDGFAQNGEVTVLLDGEIYNVRDEGKSDADVALELYREHGAVFGAYLEGVFACAVCDGDDLILVCDPVGVRPLYWGTTNSGGICFASELKAFVGVAEDVHKLHPATGYSARHGVFGYLPRHPEVRVSGSFAEAAKQVRRQLTEAVARRLEDGAVGACLLSGGLDSSIITALAHQVKPDLPAVTVGTEGAPDLENAEILATRLGIKHHVYICNPRQIAEMVPRAVWTLESLAARGETSSSAATTCSRAFPPTPSALR